MNRRSWLTENLIERACALVKQINEEEDLACGPSFFIRHLHLSTHQVRVLSKYLVDKELVVHWHGLGLMTHEYFNEIADEIMDDLAVLVREKMSKVEAVS
ncbi:MAG: hypothetical protein AAGF93_00400 [Cyanobacteria bacterium P01_H01_bin.105]